MSVLGISGAIRRASRTIGLVNAITGEVRTHLGANVGGLGHGGASPRIGWTVEKIPTVLPSARQSGDHKSYLAQAIVRTWRKRDHSIEREEHNVA